MDLATERALSGLNPKQRRRLAHIASQLTTSRPVLDELARQFPMLTEQELREHAKVLRVHGENAVELWRLAQNKWPTLAPLEIMNLIEDGALGAPRNHHSGARRGNANAAVANAFSEMADVIVHSARRVLHAGSSEVESACAKVMPNLTEEERKQLLQKAALVAVKVAAKHFLKIGV